MGHTDNPLDRILQSSRRLRIGGCRVDLALNEVHCGCQPVRLTPKAAGVLEVLVHFAGQAISRERLLAEVWRGESPTDDVVTHAIGELRRAFGDAPRRGEVIRTLPRVGYALVAEVGEWVDEDVIAASPVVPAAAAAADEGERRRARTIPGAAVASLAALLLAAIAVAVSALVRDGAATAPAEPLQPIAVTSLPGVERFPSLSPDASLVAYSAQPSPEGVSRVLVQVAGSDTTRVLSEAESEGDHAPVFSPDGRRLVFQRHLPGGGCAIVVANVLGEEERQLRGCDRRVISHIDWTPDARALLLARIPEGAGHAVLHRLGLADGRFEALDYDTAEGLSDVQARYSPDGSMIAFRRGALPHSDLWLMRADGGGQRRLTRLKSAMPGFAWTPDSRALVFASNHDGRAGLWRVAIDGGDAERIFVGDVAWPQVARLRAELVFMSDASPTHVVELAVDGLADADPPLLAPSSGMDAYGVYSPDGRAIAFVSDRRGEIGLYLAEPGGREARRLASHGRAEIADPAWSADGSALLYLVRGSGTRLVRVDVASGAQSDLTPEGHTVLSAALSPDGGHLAFSSDASGRWELWLSTLDGRPPRQLTSEGGKHPQFRDDAHLVYVSGAESGELHELALGSGEVRSLGQDISFWNQRAWQVDAGGIHALRGDTELGIYRRDWGTGDWRLLEPVGRERLAQFHLSVAPSLGRAALTVYPRAEGDIQRLRLPEAG